jgi:hypothetical protein
MLVNGAKKNCLEIIRQNPTRTVMLWGSPGIGKSAIVSAIAKELGIGFVDVRLAILNPVDLKGIPFANFETKRADWFTASFLPDAARDGERGILMLDELTSASPALQVAAYQLILDRRCGDYVLPPGWSIIAAGNKASDRGVTNRMASPLANRMMHFEIEPDLEDWKVWALMNGVHHNVLSFLNFKPSLLFAFPEAAAEIKAFPTPRTWEFVSDIMNMTNVDRYPLLVATIGEGAAIEFKSFLDVASKLPNIEQIVSTGDGDIVTTPGLQYAICGAITSNLAAKQKTGKLLIDPTGKGGMDHIKNTFKYIFKCMPAEIQTMAIMDLAKTPVQPTLATHIEYMDWLVKNMNVLT